MNISIDIILSKKLETIFSNNSFLRIFEEWQMKVSFLESISTSSYDTEGVHEIVIVSSTELNDL